MPLKRINEMEGEEWFGSIHQMADWIRFEIPIWLDKYNSYSEFMKDFPSACASINFKVIAHGMAMERWKPKLTDDEYYKIRL